MFWIPKAAEPLASAAKVAFTAPTHRRFLLLISGLIVTVGRRSISRILRSVGSLQKGHFADYHRLYSKARINLWKLSWVLTRHLVAQMPADQPLVVVADDTVCGKAGQRVWAKAAHRDPVRSSKSANRITLKYGHKWLVMGLLFQVIGATRPWLLPVLCALCTSEKAAAKANCRPRTASECTRALLIQLMRWFPDRKIILLADARASSHALAVFVHRHRDRLTLISRMRADTNLYDPPKKPRRVRGGGWAQKGQKQPKPRDRIDSLPLHQNQVAWYGSSRRCVKFVSDTGLWFGHNDGCSVVPIRWVCVLGNKKLKRKDAYFYSTDCAMDPPTIIERYAQRWNIEVTFEEQRALLGLESTRHFCRKSVLRVVPILMGLFTAVSLIWQQMCRQDPNTPQSTLLAASTPCYRKAAITFADALFAVRQELWQTTVLAHQDRKRLLNHLPESLQTLILRHLAPAA